MAQTGRRAVHQEEEMTHGLRSEDVMAHG